jgi:hypothetical protein
MGKRLKPKTNLKWGMPNRDMGGLIVTMLQYMELLFPLLIFFIIDMESMNQDKLNYLDLAMYLGMERSRKA